jgi:transketolase
MLQFCNILHWLKQFFFPYEELAHTKGNLVQCYKGHPDVQKTTQELKTGTGSLGKDSRSHWVCTLGMKLDRIENRKVYVLIGDGELDEGQNWEAAMACAAHKADNLCALYDRNSCKQPEKC